MIFNKPVLFFFLTLWALGSFIAQAQQFNGYINSDFSGIIGVRDQPAMVANSPYKFDFSLVNGNFYLANDIAVLSRSDEGGLGLVRQESFQERYAMGNTSLGGISALLSLSRNRGIAFQYKVRAMANGTDVSPNFIYQINRFNSPSFLGNSYFNESLKLSTMAWQEFAFTYGGLLKDDGFHRWKMGVTLKAVNPTGHLWLDLSDADYSIDNNGIVDLTTFDLAAGYSSNLNQYEQFDGVEEMRVLPKGAGLTFGGADVGLVYERVVYRPDPKTRAHTSLNKDITYEFRVSASITDIGVMKLEQGSASFIANGLDPNANILNLDTRLNGIGSFRELRDSLGTFLQTADASGEYTVSMPTAFRLNYDYNFGNNFFINVAAVADLSWLMPADYKVSYANSITVAPRYETGHYGMYLPIFYNFEGDTEVGLAARYGPITLGTHTLGTLFASEKKSMGFFFSINLNQLKANATKPYCFGSSKTGSAFVRKQRTPLYKRKKFIFF